MVAGQVLKWMVSLQLPSCYLPLLPSNSAQCAHLFLFTWTKYPLVIIQSLPSTHGPHFPWLSPPQPALPTCPQRPLTSRLHPSHHSPNPDHQPSLLAKHSQWCSFLGTLCSPIHSHLNSQHSECTPPNQGNLDLDSIPNTQVMGLQPQPSKGKQAYKDIAWPSRTWWITAQWAITGACPVSCQHLPHSCWMQQWLTRRARQKGQLSCEWDRRSESHFRRILLSMISLPSTTTLLPFQWHHDWWIDNRCSPCATRAQTTSRDDSRGARTGRCDGCVLPQPLHWHARAGQRPLKKTQPWRVFSVSWSCPLSSIKNSFFVRRDLCASACAASSCGTWLSICSSFS